MGRLHHIILRRAFGVGAAWRLGANAIDRLGPFGSFPYGSIARGSRQLNRLDGNPLNPPPLEAGKCLAHRRHAWVPRECDTRLSDSLVGNKESRAAFDRSASGSSTTSRACSGLARVERHPSPLLSPYQQRRAPAAARKGLHPRLEPHALVASSG